MKHKLFGYLFIVLIAAAVVAGIYHWQKVSQPSADLTNADWQTYVSAKYAFELKIPGGWKADDSAVHAGICFLSAASQAAMRDPNFEGTCDLFFDDKSYQADAAPGSLQKKTINGIEFSYYMAGPVYESAHYETTKNNRIYDFYLSRDEQLTETILGTLKFTEGISTANWKTYSNSQYGFEFKYPERMSFNSTMKNDKEFFDIGYLKAPAGSTMALRVYPQKLNSNNLTSLYGVVSQERVTTATLDGTTAYYFLEGDAGCGGPDYRAALDNSHHLSMWFVTCEDPEPTAINLSGAEINQIISTFKFIN